MVNLQTTAISWSLEFITGLVCLYVTIKSHNPETNVDLILGLVIVDAFLNLIIIPSSYILHNQASKKIIIAKGWCMLFRCCKQSDKANPNINEDIEEDIVINNQPIPIRTISGKVRTFEKQKMDLVIEDLENN